MGGKQKQAQRTKNNARPSSSSRSAERLGTAVPQFMSFTGMKESGFGASSFSLTPMDDIDSSIDLSFQFVFKKMNKKDATTKLKGLHEFTELIKTAEPEALKAVLQVWPRLYCVLSTDTEHRVREATHVAHNQMVIKAKRNIAPHLKQLVGPWFTSQYDTYPPASSAATQSFQNAFPANKLQDAIIFCQEEILNYVCDNLTVHTVNTLTNSKTHSPEDCKAKYDRVLICSLQGYSLYLEKVPDEFIRKVEVQHKRIVASNKFWKLARHELTQIRAGWFGVLTALCQKAPFVLEGQEGNVVKAAFGNLDESDPAVQRHVWESALLALTAVKDWTQYISVDEIVLPKLWRVLREAGFGNASVIYPNLLPLLSNLLPIVELEDFTSRYFDTMRLSLQLKSVQASQSESRAISVSLIECLQFTILKLNRKEPLCLSIIESQLLVLIEWCLDNGQVAYKTMFNQISALLQYWHRNQRHPDYLSYQTYLPYFWNKVEVIIMGRVNFYLDNHNEEALSDMISRQIELCLALKHTVKPKRQLRVKFAAAEDRTDAMDAQSSAINTELDACYIKSVDELAYNTCLFYINKLNQKKTPKVIDNVLSLMKDFESREMLVYITRNMTNNDPMLINLYRGMLMSWISHEKLCCKAVIDIVYMLVKYLDVRGKEEIFDSFSLIDRVDCLGWCIAGALSHPHNSDPIVQDWLQTETVGNFFVEIIKSEINGTCSAEFSLLFKQGFAENCNGDLYLNDNATVAIIRELTRCLLSRCINSTTIDTCASLASYVAPIIYTETLGLVYTDGLLLALFVFSCNNKVDAGDLSADTLWEVNTAWQDAVVAVSGFIHKPELLELCEDIATILESKLLHEDMRETEIVDQIKNFTQSVVKTNAMCAGEVLDLLLNRTFAADLRAELLELTKSAAYLKGGLCSTERLGTSAKEVEFGSIVKYFTWKSVVAGILASPIQQDVEDDEGEEDGTSAQLLYVKLADRAEELVAELLVDVVIAESLLNNFKSIKPYNTIKDQHQALSNKLITILSALDAPTKSRVDDVLNSNVYSKKWLWAKAAYIYYVTFNEATAVDAYDKILTHNPDSEDFGRLHLTQTFGPHLSYDNVDGKLSTIESIATLRCLAHCEEIEVQIAEVYSRIDKLRNEEYGRCFYNVNFSNCEQTQTIIEIIRLCSQLVRTPKIELMLRKYWDFIVISLGSWCDKLADIKNNCDDLQVSSFVCAISQLFSDVSKYIAKLTEEQPGSDYVDEWNNVFLPSVMTDLMKMWIYLAEKSQEKKYSLRLTDQIMLQEFGKFIPHITPNLIFNPKSDGMPKWSKILRQASSLLTTPVHCLQLWGYHMLVTLSTGLIEIDSVSLGANKPHEKGMLFEQFKGLLTETHNIVQAMLLDFKLGEDSCRVQPYTDSYTYTFAYLLIWDVLLGLCEKSSRELRFQYAEWLRQEDLLNSLLSTIFKLLPTEVLHYYGAKVKPFYECFEQKPELDLEESITSQKIERLVCWIYASTLSQLPASVRQWWSSVEPRASQIVERVTSAYVSPHLCMRELNDVTLHEAKFKNMVIKVHLPVREVIAIYTVDDLQMELVITLPQNYPLSGPDVQCHRQIAGAGPKQWLMQLKMFVVHQNGRIWDALSLWNNNLDKKFDGVEECYICFAVLHPSTYELPKLSCHTCRKKFHGACLYKWFNTSNKSTCPICRNLF